MHKEDLKALKKGQSVIHHKLYGEGVFVKMEGSLYQFRFGKNEYGFRADDYGVKWWLVKQKDDFIDDKHPKIGTTKESEEAFFNTVENTIQDRRNQIKQILFDLDDQSYEHIGTSGRQIAKQKSTLETEKSALIDLGNHPYFGRIDIALKTDPNHISTYYIGEQAYQDLVIDWRDERAHPYHDQDMYQNPLSDYQLSLLRKYEIYARQLVGYQDQLREQDQIIDQVSDQHLVDIIRLSRDQNIRNIVRSIQANQYRIISFDENRDLVMMGCAGSGKTMLMAHRLAFWSFRSKKGLKLEDTFLIAPSKMMQVEIANFALDLRKANLFTHQEFNRFLAKYLINQLDTYDDIADHYLEDDCLDGNQAAYFYQEQTLIEMEDYLESLIYQDHEGYLAQFQAWLDEKKFHLFMEHAHVQKNVILEDFLKYPKMYEQVLTDLACISQNDLLLYHKKVENQYHELNVAQNTRKKVIRQLQEADQAIMSLLQVLQWQYTSFGYLTRESLDTIQTTFEDLALSEQADLRMIQSLKKFLLKGYEDTLKIKRIDNDLAQLNEKRPTGWNAVFGTGRTQRKNIDSQQAELNRVKTRLEKEQQDILKVLGCREDLKEMDEMMLHLNTCAIYYEERSRALEKMNFWLAKRAEWQQELAGISTDDEVKMMKNLKKELDLMNDLRAHLKLLHVHTEKIDQTIPIIKKLSQKRIPGYRHVVQFVVDFEQFKQLKEIQNIEAYLNGRVYLPVLTVLIRFVLEMFKKGKQIPLEHHYMFELFDELYLLSKEKTFMPFTNKMILIDEVQDYSFSELFLYKRLFSNSVFNYYGDLNQNIIVCGLEKSDLDILTVSFQHFEIQENYRNAKEITEYVNHRLNIKMHPIGLPGKVLHGNLSGFLLAAKKTLDGKKKLALIVGSSQLKRIQKIKNQDILSYITDDMDQILFDKINVMTPQQAKGLEFQFVGVLTEQLSKNEQYVAMTRAVETLYVIESEKR